jgi:hypothetical protein
MTPSLSPSFASQAFSAAWCNIWYFSGGMKLASSLCVAYQIHICPAVWRERYDDIPVTATMS